MRRSSAPRALLVPAALGVALLGLPLLGLLGRVPWADLGELLGRASTTEALRTSLVVSISATALAVGLGIPLAWVLARVALPGRSAVRALVLLPVVLPPVVGGTALLAAFGRRGVLGGPLEAVGLRLPFTTAGAVVAAAFVSLPFVVLTAERALGDPAVLLAEEAAATLGAGPWRRFRTIALAQGAPALAAGAALAWARALGEFGATITFAGSVPGETRTLPLAVWQESIADPDAALALSLVLLVVSAVVLVALRRHLGALAPR